jgi:hypothetical protein
VPLVFSRCAGSLEEGRRLENLSWRLWNRETFCCGTGEANSTTPAISIASRSSEGKYTADIPDLSGSIDSLDEEAIEFDGDESASTSAPLEIARPRIQRHDSGSNRSRGCERHITPEDLEKMVITIKEKKDLEPLDISIPSYLEPLAEKIAAAQPVSPVVKAEPIVVVVESTASSISPASDSKSSQANDSVSGASERSTTSIVRGFSPSHISNSYRSIPLLNAPSSLPKSALAPSSRNTSSKKTTMFALGGSSQSENDSFNETSSMEGRMHQAQLAKKKSNVFQLGGSSGEDESSLRDNMKSSSRSSLTAALRPTQKKQTSFMEEVASRTIHEDRVMDEDPFETTDEEDIDESAIDDDDDSSEWEDSVEDSGKSSIDDKTFFQRVDSRPNLTSRRSMLTTLLHEKDRASALAGVNSKSTSALHRSRTSSPQGPSMPASPDSDDGAALMMKKKGARQGQQVTRSSAQPIIMTTTNTTGHQAALSPKTTRRNMLATELTASLRRHLLWERQQKNQTASAVLKRRHTAHDVANLKQYPEKVHIGNEDKGDHASWNQYFGQGLGEYHSKGW